MKYSCWIIEHESPYSVIAYKVKDTNSTKELDQWEQKSLDHVCSFYREEEEINANYLQTFEREY